MMASNHPNADGLNGTAWTIVARYASPQQRSVPMAQAQALSRLNIAGARLWHARSLPQGLQEMLAATIELLGADKGNVQLLDAEQGVLRIVAQQGFAPEFLDFFRAVSAKDDSACGRALRAGRPVAIEDVAAEPSYAPFLAIARSAGYRAVISMPLIGYGDRPLGVLSAHFAQRHRPTAFELEQLSLYAQLAAAFIERWQSEEAVLRQNEQRLRRALETQRVLVAELQHRARNLLAIVQSVALQILETCDTLEDFESGFVDRLLSLSRVLGLLSRESIAPVTVSSLISMELEAFCAPSDYQKISCDGPDVVLRSRMAQTLALGIHELTTNAFKHGALAQSCADGRLSISWGMQDDGEQPRLWLEWLESHIKAPACDGGPARHGYGRTLLEEELPYSLSAQTRLELAGDTLRCSISIPLGKEMTS